MCLHLRSVRVMILSDVFAIRCGALSLPLTLPAKVVKVISLYTNFNQKSSVFSNYYTYPPRAVPLP